jgi:hypothetical protein
MKINSHLVKLASRSNGRMRARTRLGPGHPTGGQTSRPLTNALTELEKAVEQAEWKIKFDAQHGAVRILTPAPSRIVLDTGRVLFFLKTP